MTNRDATNRLDLRACRMWMDRWNRSFRRVGPRRTPAGARTRSMLVGCEPLEPRLALTTFYVDDSWAGFTDGQAITDADLLLSNDQAASFGTSGAVVGATAFATIADAIQAAVNAGGSGHIIKINTGTYAESITFTESGSIAQIESLATGPDFVALNSFTLQAGLQMSGNWQTSGGFTVDAALTLAGDSHTGEVLPADMLINAAGGVTFLVGSQLNGSTAGGQGLTITSTSDVDLRGVGQGTALAFLNVQTTGALKLFDNISTSKAGGGSGALSFDATAGVQLNGLVTIATGGGDVTVNGAIDGAHVLTINAGLGDVDFQQAIGSGTPGGLVGLDVTGDEVDFAAATKVGAGGLSVTADEVSFASGASVTGLTGGGATLNVGSLLTIASGANFKLDGAFQQTGAGNVLLGADVLTEGALSFAGPISLTGDVVLSSDANQDGTGGDLTLSGAVASSIDEGFGLQIVRGANAATFAALGGLGNRLKSLAVLSTSGALGITKLGGDLFIGAGGVEFTSLVASDQKVQLQGDVAINSLGDVDLAAADVTALVNGGQSLTITAPGGVVQLGDVGAPGARLSTLVVTGTAQSVDAAGVILTTSGVSIAAQESVAVHADVDGGAGDVTFTADLGNVGANFTQDAGTIQTSGAGVVSITNAGSGDLEIGRLQVDAVDPSAKIVLTAASGSVVDLNGLLLNAIGRELNVNVSGAVAMQTAIGRLNIVAGAASAIDNLGPLQLVGDSAVTGGLLLTTGGDLTQLAGAKYVGDLTVSAAGQNISLLGTANDFGTFSTSATAVDVTLVDADGVILGGLAASGNVSITAGGNVTQSGVLAITGTSTFDPGATGSVTLADPLNTFGGAVSIPQGVDATLKASGNLTLAAATLSNDLTLNATGNLILGDLDLAGDLVATAGADISQKAGTTILVDLTTTLSASSGPFNSITLAEATNDFAGLVSITSGSNLSLADANDLQVAGATLSGGLTLVAGKALTQSGAFVVTGLTSLKGESIDFGGVANNFSFLQLNTTGGDAHVKDVNQLTLFGGLSKVVGNLSLNTNGALTQSSALEVTGNTDISTGGALVSLTDPTNDFGGLVTATSVGNTSIRDANTLTVQGTITGGNFNLTAGADVVLGDTTVTGGLLSVTAGGNVTQSAGTRIKTGPTSFDVTGDITLVNANNEFTGVGITKATNVSLHDSVSLIVAASTVSGSLTLDVVGSITQGGAISATAGQTKITAASVNLSNFTNDFNQLQVTTTGGGDASFKDANGLTFAGGASSVGGNLSVVAGGDITQTSALAITGTSTFNPGASGNVTLDIQANTFGDFVSIPQGVDALIKATGDLKVGAATLSNDLTLNATGNLILSDLDVSGDLSATAGLDVSQKSGTTITVDLTTTLSAGAGQSITLTEAGNDFGGSVSITSGANASLVDANDLDLGTTTLSGDLTLDAVGAITQSGAVSVGGQTTLDAASVAFSSFNNNFNSLKVTTTGDASFKDLTDFAFGGGASSVGGALTITAGGTISQTSAISVAGQTTITAPVVVLDDAANDFGSLQFSVTGAATFKDANDLVFGGGASNASNLTVTAVGAITQTSTLSISGATILTAASVDLDDLTNDTAVLELHTTGDATFKDADGLVFGNGASDVDGDLTISAGGAINQGAALTVGGLASFSGASIDLNDAANDFNSLQFTTAGDAAFRDQNDLVFAGGASSAASLDVLAGGAITQTSALTITGQTTLDAASVDLDDVFNNFNSLKVATTGDASFKDVTDFAFGGGASSVGGALTITAGGTISQTSAVSVAGQTTITAPVVVLDDAANDFNTLQFSVGGDATFKDANDLFFGGGASNAANLTVTAVGAITQTSAVSVGGALTLTADSVDLDDQTNNSSVIELHVVGSASYKDADGVVFGNGASDVGGDLTIIAGTTINQGAALSVGGLASFSGTNITLTNGANDFATVQFSTAGSASLNDANAIEFDDASNAANLTVTAGGAITQTADGALSISGQTTLSGTSVDLDDAANDFNTLQVTTAGDAAFNDASGLVFGGGASSVGGKLNVTAGGDVTQTDKLSVTGLATFDAAGSDVLLTDAANDFSAVAVVAGANVSLVDANALDLAGVSITGDLTVATTGDLTQTFPLSIGGDSSFDTNGNNVTLPDAANVFTGAVSIVDSVNVVIVDSTTLTFDGVNLTGDLDATGAGINQTAAAIVVAGATTLDATGGNAILDGANNDFVGQVDAANTADLTLNDSVGDLVLGDLDLTGDLVATSVGNITQAAGTTILVDLTTTLSAGAGQSIALTEAGNDFGGSVSITSGANASLVDANDLDLGTTTLTGDLTLDAVGAITQSGAISVDGQTKLDAASVSFDSFANDFNSLQVATTGDASFKDADGIVFGGGTSSVGGNLTVTAGGALTQTSAISVTGQTSLDAASATLTDPTNDFNTLQFTITGTASFADANDLVFGGGASSAADLDVTASGAITQTSTLSISGQTTLDAASVDLDDLTNDFNSLKVTTTGDASFKDANGLTFAGGASDVGGNLALTTSGAIAQGSALSVTGTTAIDSGGATVTLADPTNDFGGAVSLANVGTTSLADANSLTLGASSVTGDLTLVAANDLLQTGSVSVTGATTLTAGAAGTITFTDAGNDFVGAVEITQAGSAAITDANDLLFGDVSVAGGFDVVALGDVTQVGGTAITAGATTLDAAGDVTLANSGNDFASVSITNGVNVSIRDKNALALGTSTVTGTLTVQTAGNLTQTGPLTVTGAADFIATAGDVTLGDAGNDFKGAVSANVSAGSFTVEDANDLQFGDVTTSGDLNATSGGTITQVGGTSLLITGESTFSATGDVLLTSPTNDFVGPVNVTSAVNVSIADANDLTLGTINASGGLNVVVGGTLSLGGAISTGLGQTYDGKVQLVADTTLTTASGDVHFTSTVNGGFLLTVSAADDALFDGAVGGTTPLAGLDVTADDATFGSTIAVTNLGLTVDAINASFSGEVTTTAGGAVAIDVDTLLTILPGADFNLDGAFTQTGTGTVSLGGNVTTTDDAIAFAGAITLTNGVTLDSSTGTGADVTLSGTVTGGGNSLTLDAGATGNILFGDAATGLGAVTIDAANDVDFQLLSAVSLTQTAGQGTTTFNGAVTTSGAAGISLTGTNFTIDGTVTTTGGGGVAIDNAGLLDINAAIDSDGAVTQTGAGNVNLGANVTTTGDLVSFAGAVTLDADAKITTTGGAVTFANTLDGDQLLTIAAGTGNVTFQQAVGGTTALSGLDVTGKNVGFDSTVAIDDQGLVVSATNATFSGDVTSTTGGTVAIAVSGLLTITPGSDFTLDGSFAQTGAGTVSLGGNVTTTNDAISFAGEITLTSGVTLDSSTGTGADITLTNGVAGAGNALTLDAGTTGNILVSAAATGLGAVTIADANNVDFQKLSAVSLTQQAGQGTTTFNGPVSTSGAAGISLTGNNFTIDGTVTTTGAGGVSIDNAGLLDINAAIDSDGAVTQTGAGNVNLGANVTTTGDLVSFSGAVTLDADAKITTTGGAVTFANTLDGDQLLTIAAGTGNVTFQQAVGGTTALSGLDVTGKNVGFDSTVAIDDQGLVVSATNATFSGDVTSTTGGTVAIVVSGLLTITPGSDFTLDGSFAQTGTGAVSLGGNVTTTNDAISFAGAVTLTNAVTLDSASAGGANITLSGTVTGGGNALTLDAGTAGNILFSKAATGLGAVTINDANNVGFQTLSAVSLEQQAGQGTTTFNGPVTTSGAAGISLTGNNFTIDGIVTTTGTGGVSIVNGGLLDINAAISSDGAVTQTGAGLVNLGANITTTGDLVSIKSATTIDGAVTIATAGGDATFLSTVDGDVSGRNLTLNLGAGDATFAGAIGATVGLGTLTLASVDDASFQSVKAAAIVQTTGTGTTLFNGAVVTTGAAGVNLTGNNFTFLAPVTTQSTGSVVLNNSGLLTIAVGADFTVAGDFNQSGAGDVDFGATVQTSGGFVRFTGDVELIGAAAVKTAGGDASFLGTLDGTQDLSVTAASGDVLFDGNVGATTPLGALTIVSADDVTFSGSVSALSLTQTAGAGTTTFNGAIATSGAAGIDLNGNVFTFNNGATVATTGGGGLSITNAGALSIAAGADFNLDGAFLQDGAGAVDAAGDIATTNDALTWNANVTLTGNVSFTTGAGTITFQNQFLVGSRTANFNSTANVQLGVQTALEGGQINSTSQLDVGAGEEVIGRGTIMASLLIGSGGLLSPGSAAGGAIGTLTIDTLTMQAGSTLAMQWRGQAPAQRDQIQILSNMNPTGATLALTVGPNFVPLLGQVDRLIDNQSGNNIGGSFAGYPNGSVFTFTTVEGLSGRLQITYFGGNGNDVEVQVFQQPLLIDVADFDLTPPILFIPVPVQFIPVVVDTFRPTFQYTTTQQTPIDAGEFKIAIRIEEIAGRGSDKVVRTVYNNVIPSSDLVGTLRLLAREPWGHYRITFEVVDPLRPEARGEVIEIELNADNQESLFRDLDSVWDVLEYTPPWRDVEPTTEEPGEELSAEETPADESQNAAQAEPTRSGDAHDSLSFDAFDLMFAILPAARPLAAFSAFSELSAEWTAPLLAEEAGDEASDELSADLGERVWQQWPARSARNAAVEASFELEADEREAEASGETTALDAVAAAAIAAPALAAAWDALRAGRKAGERTNERASVPGRQEAAGMSR